MFNRKKIENLDSDILRFTIIREQQINGHDVGLFLIENLERPNSSDSPEPMCECDFNTEEKIDKNGNKYSLKLADSHTCPHLAEFRKRCMREAREKYGNSWKNMGVKEAILDIYRRVKAHEYLGTRYGAMIYLQEVSDLLGVPVPWDDADELFKEGRLQLNGAILCDYQEQFRFPKELNGLMCYIVEAPIGWPNGEAGSCLMGEICKIIVKELGISQGKYLFGNHAKHIQDAQLLTLGLALLFVVIERAENERRARGQLLFTSLERTIALIKEAKESVAMFYTSSKSASENHTITPKDLARLMLSEDHLDLKSNGEKKTPQFSFPREIRWATAYLMQDNGTEKSWVSARKIVQEIENAIARTGRWERGEDAFWEHNYPNISTDNIVQFGTAWIFLAIKNMKKEKNPSVPSNTKQDLQELERRYAHLAKRMRFWQFLTQKQFALRIRFWNIRARFHNFKDRIMELIQK